MANKKQNPKVSKGKKRDKKSSRIAKKPKTASRTKRKSSWLGGVIAAVVLTTLSVAGVASYQHFYDKQTDLSVIGNGVATVVQVHDPSCSMCRQLKDNTQVALKRMGDKVQYRIADLTSAAGRSFAGQYDSQKVTLVTFARDGKFHKKFSGVRSADTLEVLFKELVRR